MDHRPFPKIPTTLEDSGGVGSTWVATEKIHGAQLVVATDGEVVRLGKRKAWLEPDDAFFGWQMLRGELERKVRRLHGGARLGWARAPRLRGARVGPARGPRFSSNCCGAAGLRASVGR